MTTKAQQSAIDNALVAQENQRVIGKCNMRINPGMKPKEPTYKIATVNKHKASYRFKIDNKRFSVNVEVFREILNICPRVLSQEFDEPSSEEEALSFIRELGAEPPKSLKSQKKSDLDISFVESSSKKKPASKTNLTKKKALVKADRGKGDNGEEYDDDEDDTEDDKGNDDDDSDGNNDNDGNDDDNDEHEEEENVDEFTDKEDDEENEEESDDGEEFYTDVNVNLKKEDVKMTDVDQGGADQHNETEGPMQSSSVSSDFIEKLLNFENVSLIDNEIASLMDTTVHNEEPSDQTSTLFTLPITSTYKAAASLSEYKLTKILLDKMEESKSHLRADYKRELYDALDKSYNIDKDLFETYGEVFTLKRSRDEKDKDQDPSAGSDRGPKRRKSSKEAESQKYPRSKERKSSSSSKDTSCSHHKSSRKSAYVEEPSHIVDDFGVQKNQESDICNNDEQPNDEAAPKNDCSRNPSDL
nr:hypothetical protein [Tanacetum cinerariifolium]